jgi:putative membrane protein insertion efficiency factor
MSRALIALIKAYQYLLSPMLGSRCRFYPSCSEYAHQAIAERGAVTGIFLSLKRLSRCHPWCEGGYDPLPKK